MASKLNIMLLVITVGLQLNLQCASSESGVAVLVEMGIRLVLLNLKRIEKISIFNETEIIIPDDLKNITVGSLILKNTGIDGLDSLEIRDIDVQDSMVDNNLKLNTCINITFNQIEIITDYDADIGIINEIPIYGNGKVNLSFSQFKTDACLDITAANNFSDFYVDNLWLQLRLHDSPSSITRFWENDEASELLTLIINILEKFACMWISYENECITCVLSTVIQNFLNSALSNNDDSKVNSINCSCLQNNVEHKFKMKNNLELVSNHNEGIPLTQLDNLIYNDINGLIEFVIYNIITFVKK